MSLVKTHSPGQSARKLSEYTPQYLELMTDFAVRYHVNIIGGSQFTLEGDELFNVAYLFCRDGTKASNIRFHVTPNEARWWGSAPAIRSKF
ncbi:MAG: hypothetical protein R3C68_11420 [Myxococcota bacterium]